MGHAPHRLTERALHPGPRQPSRPPHPHTIRKPTLMGQHFNPVFLADGSDTVIGQIGTWARQRISVADKAPTGYTEVQFRAWFD